MSIDTKRTGLELRSLVKSSGELELSLVSTVISTPAPDEVVVRIEASPINPSDIGLLFGAADMSTAHASGSADNPVVTASIPERFLKSMAGRLDQSMPVGNEGAGAVVEAGASGAAQALLGKTVAVIGGAMYAQYRCIKVDQCLVLPDGTTPAEGASCFVNPLLLFPFLQRIGVEAAQSLKQRVVRELKTTFASTYSKQISLAQALQMSEISEYGKRATGAKYLINPGMVQTA